MTIKINDFFELESKDPNPKRRYFSNPFQNKVAILCIWSDLIKREIETYTFEELKQIALSEENNRRNNEM